MKRPLFLAITSSLLASAAWAQTTVTYQFNVDQELQLATITGSDPDISASNINNTSVVGVGGYETGTSDWGITGSTPDADGTNYFYVRAPALAGSDPSPSNDYISFTITANSGAFNVTGASLQARSSGTFNFALRSDADSFTADLLAGNTGLNTFSNFENLTIGGLTNQTSTEFRLFMWGTGGVSDVNRIDNLSLTTTAVPEPSMFGLLAVVFGLAGFARRRNRQK